MVGGYIEALQQVPYPSTPQNIESVLVQLAGNPAAIAELKDYGAQQCNREKVAADFIVL